MRFALISRKCFEMKKLYYDLHIHSCLSPCADDDMTPNNISGMAKLKGLDIVALTDHNTCGNCRSFIASAEKQGIVGVAGMELTTSEDIHIVCLFEQLEDAEGFSAEVEKYRVPFENRVDIFGEQYYLDENDEIIGTEKNYLPIATGLDIETATSLAREMGGFVWPAHIDRESNGIVAVLGTLPDRPEYTAIELNKSESLESLTESIPSLKEKAVLVSSDAHYLWDINEAENSLELDIDSDDPTEVRRALFEYLNKW